MPHPFADFPKLKRWSERVISVLGLNPNIFTGPGTNTFIIGTGRRRLLLDTGQAVEGYVELLEQALDDARCELEAIVVTHSHPDHLGGVEAIQERFGNLPVLKLPHPRGAFASDLEIEALRDGQVVEVEGATLRALHTPGHAEDHLCFWLEEEEAIFTGDNVLHPAVGTPVILMSSGDLGAYLHSLELLEALAPTQLYPGHGERIEAGVAELRAILAHRAQRDAQIIAGLREGPAMIGELVAKIYTDVPAVLHPAAAQSVGSHLLKLEQEGRAARVIPQAPALETPWRLVK